jgi:hypothetical protein
VTGERRDVVRRVMRQGRHKPTRFHHPTSRQETPTMTNTATKTKRTKIADLRPPREIRENTKARREWLAAQCAEMNAAPNTEAKIVGTGSYQSVSVYRVEASARSAGTRRS